MTSTAWSLDFCLERVLQRTHGRGKSRALGTGSGILVSHREIRAKRSVGRATWIRIGVIGHCVVDQVLRELEDELRAVASGYAGGPVVQHGEQDRGALPPERRRIAQRAFGVAMREDGRAVVGRFERRTKIHVSPQDVAESR